LDIGHCAYVEGPPGSDYFHDFGRDCIPAHDGFFAQQTPSSRRHCPASREEEESVGGSFWQNHNPEIDQLLQEIRHEKEDLAKREAELRELATRLQAERAEINTVTQRVVQLQSEFDQNVIRVREEELPSLKKLAKLYTSMTPEAVLAIFKEMDDQTVAKILRSMKESETAPLLEGMAKQVKLRPNEPPRFPKL
jgi:flagellar motility protein MotE (MotC chaperone)